MSRRNVPNKASQVQLSAVITLRIALASNSSPLASTYASSATNGTTTATTELKM
jgi:hypothetical protein